ncbi:MAG: PDZ domain-containing protein [Desulfobacterales bacterium]|nr:PDZ domain-containing protein [Desulfobacterales bacterium]
MKKNMIWLGPITVLAFVAVLTVMYGWVGSINSIGHETRETPEVSPANQVQPRPDNRADRRAGRQGQGGQLVHHGRFPAGIGNGQIQLINNPTFPAGIGNQQIQLINNTTFPAGIGNGQIQLINQNNPAQPFLGLNLSEVNEVVAKELKLPAGTGVYVNKVVAMSPGQKAGIKTGDVILKCAHKTVNTPEQVGQILAGKKAGDVIKVVVNRNGGKKSFHVKLENAPMGLDVGAIQNPTWMGADIQDIDTVMKIQFNLPDNRGVIVSHVAQNSPAQAAGLRTGDMIRRFGGTRLQDVKQLQSLILGSRPGQQVRLTILRNGRHLALDVIPGHKPLGSATPNIPFIAPADMAIEGSWIGMDVTEASANDVAALGLPAGTRGILVNDVESPPATMVGFQTGDVIMAVNGSPTPDMKQFVAASKKQSGAVVDIIRGNKHLFISVPPPGFTLQGTQLNTGVNNKFRQVAMAGPIRGRLGIFASGPDLNSPVVGNTTNLPYLILVDLSNNSYAVMDPNSLNSLPQVLQQHKVTGLVCANISGPTAATLASRGVVIYSGVVGTAGDAIHLYETNRLIAMKGL